MKQALSPKELAHAIGVSQSSIKRWADDGLIRVSRTAGGHRRIPLAEAIRFVRESEVDLLRPQVLGLPEVDGFAGRRVSLEGAAEELTGYLQAGASPQARGLLLALFLAGYHVAQLADGPVRSALERIGQLWKHGEDGVFVEHQATQICLQAFHQLRSLLPAVDLGPLALGGAPPGDPYQLPSLLAATLLEVEGFKVLNLGPETPVSILTGATLSRRPKLVWLSITHAREPDALERQVEELLEAMAKVGGALAIGGREAHLLELRPRPRLGQGQSLAELLAFVRGLGKLNAQPS